MVPVRPRRAAPALLALLLLSAFGAVAQGVPPQMGQALNSAIQEELLRRGYNPGSVDGVIGSRTRTAIRAYQRDVGLPADGQPSKELLDSLKFSQAAAQTRPAPARAAVPEAPRPSPRPGARRASSDLALAIQRELQVRGYYTGPLDGGTGAATRSAIRAFQRDAGFPVTGDIDERLLAELRAVDANIRAGRRP